MRDFFWDKKYFEIDMMQKNIMIKTDLSLINFENILCHKEKEVNYGG